MDAPSWSWLFDSVTAALHSLFMKPKLVQNTHNYADIITRNGRKKGKQTVDLPNKPLTAHCIIQMHCSLLFPHKPYKWNTQTGYQLPLSKGKSWLSGSPPVELSLPQVRCLECPVLRLRPSGSAAWSFGRAQVYARYWRWRRRLLNDVGFSFSFGSSSFSAWYT